MYEEDGWFWQNRWKILLITTLSVFFGGLISAGIYHEFTRPQPKTLSIESPNPTSSRVAIPNVVGYPIEEALEILNDNRNLIVETVYRENNTYPENTVFGQSIPAGSLLLNKKQILILEVSSGGLNSDSRNKAVVPSVIGFPRKAAENTLNTLGFKDISFVELNSDSPKGTIMAQSPQQERLVPVETKITLFVSTGRVIVPDLIGLSFSASRQILEEAGLKYSLQNTAGIADTTIVTEQSVPAGTTVKPNTTIRLGFTTRDGSLETPQQTPNPSPSETLTPSSPSPSPSTPSPDASPTPSPEPTPEPTPNLDPTNPTVE
jgi:beta-lactam-binding protein with PASTA domain